MEEMQKDVQNPGLKEEWEDSIEPVKVLMSSVFQCLSLKGKTFSSFQTLLIMKLRLSFPAFVTLMLT